MSDTTYIEEVKETISSIHHDMLTMDKALDRTNNVRTKLVDKLVSIVDVLEVDTNLDSSKLIEAKMAIINTLGGQLNDIDKQHLNRVKLKSAVKSEESNSDHKKAVAEYLKNKVNKPNDFVNSEYFDNVDEEIEQQLLEADIKISEAELKTDAMDLD